jgi:hypothetical protein
MTNIFIDISILLTHRSQIAKCVFLGYHPTIESNIPCSCVVALKSHFMYSVLDLLSLKLFASKIRLHNSNFWSTPILLSSIKTILSTKSMHQGIPPYMSLVTPSITKAKRIRAQRQPLMQSYINWKGICVFVTRWNLSQHYRTYP